MPASLFEGERLRARVFDASHKNLVVTFDHWRPAKAGFGGPQSEPTFFSRRRYSHISVETSTNDWYINSEVGAMLEKVAAFTDRFDFVGSLAFSMGAYGALLASAVFDFDRLVLVSPLASVSPIRVQNDRRFKEDIHDMRAAERVDNFLHSGRRTGTNCAILFDPVIRSDRAHANLAARLFINPEMVPVANAGHPATQGMTKAGHFGRLVDALFHTEPIGQVVRGIEEKSNRHIETASVPFPYQVPLLGRFSRPTVLF